MLVTPVALTREWGSKGVPGPDNILTTPTPAPAPKECSDSPAFSSKLLKLNCSQDLPLLPWSVLVRPASSSKGGPETAMSL